jgi:putative effector of murein hydrolase
MSNHKMGHHQTQVNLAPLKVSKTIVMEIRKQLVGIEVIQPLNVVIPTIAVEIVVAPNTNFVKGGILIEFAMNLGCGNWVGF